MEAACHTCDHSAPSPLEGPRPRVATLASEKRFLLLISKETAVRPEDALTSLAAQHDDLQALWAPQSRWQGVFSPYSEVEAPGRPTHLSGELAAFLLQTLAASV